MRMGIICCRYFMDKLLQKEETMIANLTNQLGAIKKEIYALKGRIITVSYFESFFIVCDVDNNKASKYSNELLPEIQEKYLSKLNLQETYNY